MEIEERAQAGLLLVSIPSGNSRSENIYLLKSALNAQRAARGEAEMPAPEFMKLVKEKLGFMKMDASFYSVPSMKVSLAVRKSATKFFRCWCFSQSPCLMKLTLVSILTR